MGNTRTDLVRDERGSVQCVHLTIQVQHIVLHVRVDTDWHLCRILRTGEGREREERESIYVSYTLGSNIIEQHTDPGTQILTSAFSVRVQAQTKYCS